MPLGAQLRANYLYQSPPPRFGNSGRGDGKDIRACRWGGQWHGVGFSHDGAVALVNSQQLWSPASNLDKIKPMKVPV